MTEQATANGDSCTNCGRHIPFHHVRLSYLREFDDGTKRWVSVCMRCEEEVSQTWEPFSDEA